MRTIQWHVYVVEFCTVKTKGLKVRTSGSMTFINPPLSTKKQNPQVREGYLKPNI